MGVWRAPWYVKQVTVEASEGRSSPPISKFFLSKSTCTSCARDFWVFGGAKICKLLWFCWLRGGNIFLGKCY